MTEDKFKRIMLQAQAGVAAEPSDVIALCDVVMKLRKALSEAHQANGELRAQLSETKVMI